MPKGVPKDPESARKPGPAAVLKDPIHWRGGWVSLEHKAWIDSHGGIAAVRGLIDKAMAAEHAGTFENPAQGTAP